MNRYEQARKQFEAAREQAKGDKIMHGLIEGLIILSHALEDDVKTIRERQNPLHGGAGRA